MHPTHRAILDEALARGLARLAHKRRCRALPPVTSEEAARLVGEFFARGGAVTRIVPADPLAAGGVPVGPRNVSSFNADAAATRPRHT